MHWRLLVLLLLRDLPAAAAASKCFACSGLCVAPHLCNCQTGHCESNVCFAERLPAGRLARQGEELWLTKGCASNPPRDPDGCDYDRTTERLLCFCRGEFCNHETLLPSEVTDSSRKLVRCSECRGSSCEKCRGEYCYQSVKHKVRACQFGAAVLPFSIRGDDYFTTGRRVACVSTASAGRWDTECVCRADGCNDPADDERRALVVAAADAAAFHPPPPLHQCYSCSNVPSDGRSARACLSQRCVGEFCTLRFVASPEALRNGGMTMSGGGAAPLGSWTAGCLNSTVPDLVLTGCSHYFTSPSLQRVECACAADYCNRDMHAASATRRALSSSLWPLSLLVIAVSLTLY